MICWPRHSRSRRDSPGYLTHATRAQSAGFRSAQSIVRARCRRRYHTQKATRYCGTFTHSLSYNRRSVISVVFLSLSSPLPCSSSTFHQQLSHSAATLSHTLFPASMSAAVAPTHPLPLSHSASAKLPSDLPHQNLAQPAKHSSSSSSSSGAVMTVTPTTLGNATVAHTQPAKPSLKHATSQP